jgi:hypothetical protein
VLFNCQRGSPGFVLSEPKDEKSGILRAALKANPLNAYVDAYVKIQFAPLHAVDNQNNRVGSGIMLPCA